MSGYACKDCEDSGWLDTPDGNAVVACHCRDQLLASRRSRSLSAVIPRRYRGASFDRPPISSMPSAQVDLVKSYVRQLDERLAEGRGLWFFGGVGTGKTTLASCAVRFLDPSSGRVTLGGTDIRQLSQDALRSAVRLVSQDAYLFTTTIAQNVRLAAPEADDEKIIAALARAGLGPWIASLPEGIETLVGEEGAEVSGGQRGRIALARGFIAQSQIVILDEPTANLDAAGARDLLSAIGSERSDRRAMLVITHTVEGLEEFDEIIVLEAGTVVERGTWVDLIAAEGALARLSAAA